MKKPSCIIVVIILLSTMVLTVDLVKGQEKEVTFSSSEQYMKGCRYNIQGWIYLHIEGDPYERGGQHGYLLASEIVDMLNRWSNTIHNYKLVKPLTKHFSESRYHKVSEAWWDFCTKQCHKMYWDKFPEEYQQEIEGIAAGVNARGGRIHGRDVNYKDILAMNEMYEFMSKLTRMPKGFHPLRTFFHQLEKIEPKTSDIKESDFIDNFLQTKSADHCNGFIATGDATTDGQIVFSHSTICGGGNWWWTYYISLRWNVILDVQPTKGNRVIMPSSPGLIWSDEDYYQNDNGIVLLETTNDQGLFDNKGLPLSVRARSAMQYGNSIDDVIYHLRYRNDGSMNAVWLIGDDKTGEIARFELGYKAHATWRTYDGFYWSANNPFDTKVRIEKFYPKKYLKGLLYKLVNIHTLEYQTIRYLPAPRDIKYEELGEKYYGQIDIDAVKEIMSTPPIGSWITDIKITDSSLHEHNGIWAFFGKPNDVLNLTNLDNPEPEIQSVCPTGWVRMFGVSSKNGFELIHQYDDIGGEIDDTDVIWEFDTENNVNDFFSSSAVYEDVLYVSASNGKVYAINSTNGNVKWDKDVGRNPVTPVVEDGLVFVGHSKGLSVYDLDGDIRWETSSGNVVSKPVVIDDCVVFGDNVGYLYVYNIDNEKEQWHLNFPGEIYISSSNRDNYVYVTSDNSCYAVNLKDQKVSWSFQTEGMITSAPVFSSNKVFFASWDNYVYAVDAYSGDLEWSYETGWGVDASPVVSDDLVLLGCNDNNFYALNKDNGDLEWVYTCNAGIHSNPVIYGEYVFFGCDDGRFYTLDKTNGDLAWFFTPSHSINNSDLYSYITTPIVSDPVVNNGIVYLGASGTVYALETGTVEEIKTVGKEEKAGLPTITGVFIVLSLLCVIFVTILYLYWTKRSGVK